MPARWAGVPFVMKAGKALNERKVEIRVQFKPPAAGIHKNSLNEMRNELVVRAAGGVMCSIKASCVIFAGLEALLHAAVPAAHCGCGGMARPSSPHDA